MWEKTLIKSKLFTSVIYFQELNIASDSPFSFGDQYSSEAQLLCGAALILSRQPLTINFTILAIYGILSYWNSFVFPRNQKKPGLTLSIESPLEMTQEIRNSFIDLSNQKRKIYFGIQIPNQKPGPKTLFSFYSWYRSLAGLHFLTKDQAVAHLLSTTGIKLQNTHTSTLTGILSKPMGHLKQKQSNCRIHTQDF